MQYIAKLELDHSCTASILSFDDALRHWVFAEQRAEVRTYRQHKFGSGIVMEES